MNSISAPASCALFSAFTRICSRNGSAKARVVEQAHMVLAEERSHPAGVAEAGKRPLDHDPVEAGQHARELAGVTVEQRGHRNLAVTRPSSRHPARGGYGSRASSASMSL